MQRSARIRLTTALAALASMTFIAATSTRPFDPLESVPAGAVAVVTIGDPSTLLRNITGFLHGAGLDKPAVAIEDFISSLLAPSDGGAIPESARTLFNAVDLGRRLIVAVYPGMESAGRPVALLFLPLRSTLSPKEQMDLNAALNETLESETEPGSISMDYPGYVVVRTDSAVIPAYGSGATMNLARLAAYPASSVAVWADPNAGAQYLDLLPDNLGALLPGQDDGYQDDYEYWPEDLPLDAETQEESFVDTEAWIDNEAVDNEGSGGLVDNEGAGSLTDNEADVDVVNPLDNEQAEENIEYAEDYSWDDEAGLEEAEAAPSADPFSGAFGQIGDTLKKGLEELSGIELAIIVQKDRIWVRAGAELNAGGSLAPLARRAAAGDASLPYLAYCEADALVSVAWSAPYDWSLPLAEALYKLVLPGDELAGAAMASMKSYAASTGMNGGLSLGVAPSEELLQAFRAGIDAADGNLVKLLARGLGLKVSGALELTDRQAFRDAAAGAVDFARYPGYMELLASSGFAIDISRATGVVEGMPYDAFTYSFKSQEDAGYPGAAVAELIGRLISPVYFYAEDKAFFGLGPLRQASAAVPRYGARQPLRSDRTFKALRAGAPADTRAIFYLSTKALSRLLLRARPADQAPLGYNAGNLSGFLSWLDASPTTVGFGMGIGAEDIKAIVAVFNQAEWPVSGAHYP